MPVHPGTRRGGYQGWALFTLSKSERAKRAETFVPNGSLRGLAHISRGRKSASADVAVAQAKLFIGAEYASANLHRPTSRTFFRWARLGISLKIDVCRESSENAKERIESLLNEQLVLGIGIDEQKEPDHDERLLLIEFERLRDVAGDAGDAFGT